jgi:hypothetical protein
VTKPYRMTAAIIGMVLITQGCSKAAPTAGPLPQPTPTLSDGSEPGGSFQLTVPTSLEASPEVAAAALVDPDLVEEGVWFLLRGLGIGVYTGDGEQVLAGSETGPNDFWIYNFEFPLMVRLAMEPSRPFSEFHPQLHDAGLESSQEETLKLYKDVYEASSSAYLARLFVAMGLDFEGDPEITPLQEWLLLLDTFLPPNASASTGQGEPLWVRFGGMGMMAPSLQGAARGPGVSTRPAQVPPCGWIAGGAFHANWGLVNSVTGADDLVRAEIMYYAIHGPLLARGVGAELLANEDHAHEGHGAPGDTITFDVVMDINYRLGGLIPIGFPTCGYLVNLDPPLKAGSLPAAQVWWRPGPEFGNHGSFRDVHSNVFDGSRPTDTDPSGKTSITFQARQEPANGLGSEHSLRETVRASFAPRAWIAAMGLKDPRLLAFLPPTLQISPAVSVTLGWHEIVSYELEFDSLFVTNTFTPSGTSGPINVSQHVRAVVPLEWSEQDQTYTGQAPLDYVLFDVPPIIGIGGDGGFFDPCPNTTSATGGTFRVLRLEGLMDGNTPQPGQAQVSSLHLTIDPGTTVESIVPVCPPPATVPPGFSFPLLTWSQVFASAHNRETQAGTAPYIITDWVVGSETIVATKSYASTTSVMGILTTTESTTITLVQR